MTDPQLINLGYYKFIPLASLGKSLPEWRIELLDFCKRLDLMGTILIAEEGVNAMLSGDAFAIGAIKDKARKDFQICDSAFKEARVSEHSFKRMLVKIKREIIPVGDPQIRPYEKTARSITAQELKVWLDESRDIVLLDTRNRYEVEVGTFRDAQTLDIDHSRDFVNAAAQNLEKWQNKTVVTFCTGGIRCEKASAALLDLGLKDVYQLDGGILRYFEKNGSSHFDGSCFVFDWRLAVNGELKPVARSTDPKKLYGRHQKPRSEIQDSFP